MHFIINFYLMKIVRLGYMDLFIRMFIIDIEIINLILLNALRKLMIQFLHYQKKIATLIPP